MCNEKWQIPFLVRAQQQEKKVRTHRPDLWAMVQSGRRASLNSTAKDNKQEKNAVQKIKIEKCNLRISGTAQLG